MYSALKHDGHRLYRLARAGIEVERPARAVRIERLDCLGIGPDWIEFEVACGKGTYVRTLAEDLARALGTVGHVASLRRLGLGPFLATHMRTLAEIEEAGADQARMDALLIPVDEALPGLPAIQLGDADQAWILQGRPVAAKGPGASRVRIYGVGGRFLGVGRMSEEGARLAPERIMVELPDRPASRA
jgi:tRNA pseudouridine55 synthase